MAPLCAVLGRSWNLRWRSWVALGALVQDLGAESGPNQKGKAIGKAAAPGSSGSPGAPQSPCRCFLSLSLHQSSALNNGWGLARGDYIGYLSADDTYELNAISNLVECLENNPNAILSYGDWSLINSNSKQLRGISGKDYSKFDLKNRLACVVGPGSIFKREIYSEYGGWDTEYRRVPDFEYFFRICESGDFIRVKKKLANFRIHSNSYSSARISKKLSDEIITLVKKSNSNDNFYKLRLASAHLISFKWHLISNRPLLAINRIFLSIFYHPLYLTSFSFYRVILSSIFNGLIYRVKRIEKS